MEYAVKINLYRGKKTFDEHGNISSEMSAMDLPTYKSLEWTNFMKYATIVGYTDGKLISVSEIHYTTKDKPNGKHGEVVTTTSYEPVKMDSEIVAEIAAVVKEAFEIKRVALTPEQQEIADLKAIVAGLVDSKPKKAEKPVKEKAAPKAEIKVEAPKESDSSNELEDARGKYTELYGKKPSHLMKLEGLNKKIAEKLAE